jgi:oxygen-independent coproporphyrinogen-3 oxidase
MTGDFPGNPVAVTPELLTKYDKPGPRYTSYPTAPEWDDHFGDGEYRQALTNASKHPDQALSLYVHLPFCKERCSFCACNVVISKKDEVAEPYVDYVLREVTMAADQLGERRLVRQMHWGGGTPTYLPPALIRRLFEGIAERFELTPDAEIAIEVDPRVTSHEQVALLRSLGFNRISMGVQDLDPEVQRLINRNQSAEQTLQLVAWSREHGFQGINFDLIYGLPGQTLETWANTVNRTIEIRPDRLAVYNFAHLPDKVHHQRKIDPALLPRGPEKYELFALARRLFEEAGYRTIGMDHFALPTDELAIAMDERRLHRNFMGYTVVPAAEMIAFGTSSIGEIGGAYAQNEKRLFKYYRALDEGRFPTSCGCFLTDDDMLRRWLIRQIMCNFYLDVAELKQRFGVDYNTYFAQEEQRLAPLYNEGFLRRENGNLLILPLGHVFVRNIAMEFDAYLRRPEAHRQFSRTV